MAAIQAAVAAEGEEAADAGSDGTLAARSFTAAVATPPLASVEQARQAQGRRALCRHEPDQSAHPRLTAAAAKKTTAAGITTEAEAN
jgi:hypothetical protein